MSTMNHAFNTLDKSCEVRHFTFDVSYGSEKFGIILPSTDLQYRGGLTTTCYQ